MPITRTIIDYALYALDAYRRGQVINSRFNNATVIGLMDDRTTHDGFYAIAYETDHGQIILSYRGTNPSFSDVVYGWPLAVGDWGISQARSAMEFYRHIRREKPENATISVTGHSLGGGLGGFVAGLTGLSAYIFDPMPYKLAVRNAYQSIQENSSQALTYFDDLSAVQPPSFEKIEPYALEGEVLQFLREILEGDIGTTYLNPYFGGYSRGFFGRISDALNIPRIKKHSLEILLQNLYLQQVFTERERANISVVGDRLYDHLFTEIARPIAYSGARGEGTPYGTTALGAMLDKALLGGKILADAQSSVSYIEGLLYLNCGLEARRNSFGKKVIQLAFRLTM